MRSTLQRVDGRWQVEGRTKTKLSRRVLQLGAEEARQLHRQRRRQLELRLAAGAAWEDNDLIFAGPLGTPLDPTAIKRRALTPLLKAAGLPDMRAYDLRHSAACLMRASGADIKTISTRLGHSGVVLTLDTYVHEGPAEQQAAVDGLNRMLG